MCQAFVIRMLDPGPMPSQLTNARYAFVDVETTGFHPSYARVVEVACIVVERRDIIARFETLIDPKMSIPRFATAIHGITDASVCGKPSLGAVQQQLLRYCGDATVVAHNACFDLSFLPFLRCRPVACTYQLAARIAPEALE